MRKAILIALLAAFGAQADAPAPWPDIALPEQARSYGIGQQMDINGLPLRLTGFASRSSPAQTAEWFRRSLGPPLMDDRLAGQRILGRAQGEHYITVRIEPDPGGDGSRGIVAVTHLRAALRDQARSQDERTRWQSLLPAGSVIGSLLQAQEGGRRSSHLIATNRHGEPLNAQHLTEALQQRGYALESRFAATAGPPGLTLLLRGPGKEATATIRRDAQGLTHIVLATSVAEPAQP